MTEEHAARTGPALGIFAHPDDAEICAGGLMAKWAASGREVHLMILTNGDRGSQDPGMDRRELAAIRARETEAAGRVLGLASLRIGEISDSELANTEQVREAVVRRIRELQVETVVTCDPTAVFFERIYYNHSDHRTAGFVALDSCYPGSGNPHFFAHHLDEGLPAKDVYDLWLGWTNEPTHTEDVTAHWDAKIGALAEHASQLSEGIRFFDEMLGKEAAKAGVKIGVERAEEFRVLDLS